MFFMSWLTTIELVIATASVAAEVDTEPVRFNRDIRPILSDNCFACHGPDANTRQADLRLDQAEEARVDRGGSAAIVPGLPDQSELIRRIYSSDDDERMPPPDAPRHLTHEQKQLLRRWIAQGAVYEPHWSFLPIERPTLPENDDAVGAANPIDRFIRERLRENGLKPSRQANAVTLARRVAFDLTGLPPTLEQVASLVADPSDATYETLVDELLDSPRFGERMAMWWLDLVRYADSVGYHGDQPVSVYPFREWVIRAFNNNMPFDQFTIEQLAGDLLSDPTVDQKIASGYNRLGMMSAEGGVQDKEYLAKYIAERVRNVGGTWLGLTLGCAECHDHKFDPVTTKDFYRFEAFFADIKEKGLYGAAHVTGDWGPSLRLPTPQQAAELAQLETKLKTLQEEIDQPTAEIVDAQIKWEQSMAAADDKLPEKIRKLLKIAADKRSESERTELATYYRSIAPSLKSLRKELAKVKRNRDKLAQQIPTTLITETVKPRTIRVLPRGNWKDDSGDVVQPGLPEFLPQPPLAAERLNRLDLARWIVSRKNPLTARVVVNRLWKMFFGTGLSRKLDDLGTQGEWPSHPQLLDWLAVGFMQDGWDFKRTVKQIVMSSAYRQSSLVKPELYKKDPQNRWFARQGRFRLAAEMVRDNALWISGLLVERVGGRSVKPYQPSGYWAYLNFPARQWENENGDDLYRRGLYTHWQRQYLHPSLLAFDASSREECTADRPRSNTPLQSLVLLNDPTYVEAARVFAEMIVREGGSTTTERLDFAFRRALSRPIKPQETDLLGELLQRHSVEYQRNPDAATELLSVGECLRASDIDPVELAAWTSIARTILNLHATITRN